MHVGLNKRGEAFALLGLVQLYLVKPQNSLDPALYPTLEKETLESALSNLYTPQIEIFGQYEHLPLAGEQKNLKYLLQSHEALQNQINGLKKAGVYRPSDSRYPNLCEDIESFCKHLGSVDRVLKMIQDLRLDTDTLFSQQEAKLWIENIGIFMGELESKYPHYVDVYTPVERALEQLRYGVELMRGSLCTLNLLNESKGENISVSYDDMHRMMNDYIASLLSFHTPEEMLPLPSSSSVSMLLNLLVCQLPDNKNITNRLSESLKLYIINMGDVKVRCTFALSEVEVDAARSRLELIGRDIHGLWEAIQEEQKRLDHESNSSFRVKEKHLDLPMDEEIDEKEYASYFPEQFSKFEDLDQDSTRADSMSLAYNVSLDFDRKKEYKRITGVVLREMFQAFEIAYFDDQKVDKLEISFLLGRRNNTGYEMVQNLSHILDSSLNKKALDSFLFGAMSLLSESNNRLTDSDGSIDMYTSNPSQAKALYDPLYLLLQKIDTLLEEWPENPILEQLKAIINRIFELPTSSPLKAFSTGIELLLSKAQLWEETAAKHVTLQEQLKVLISLAAEFRKRELNGWKNALNRVKTEIEEDAMVSWFHLFGIVGAEDVPIQQFINLIDEFIQMSPLGQFEFRLHILDVLQARAKVRAHEPLEKHWSIILKNICTYYRQFSSKIADTISAGLKPLEQDLRDFITLSKWEDRGYYSMKSATEQAQRQLHKLIKKAKEVLQVTCYQHFLSFSKRIGIDNINQESKLSTTKDIIEKLLSPGTELKDLEGAWASKELSAQEFSCEWKFSSRCFSIGSKFTHIVQETIVLMEPRVKPVAMECDHLAFKLVHHSATLKEDSSKGAKSRKKKALVDFFTALEDLGVSKLLSAIPSRERDKHAWLQQVSTNDLALLLRGIITSVFI